ncbi:MAG: hypothetical protein PVJ38_01565 [Candidatus Bathyarchaeota archaeon]|jgi:hypothetical protein
MVNGEEETRKMLQIRERLEKRIGRLEMEIQDLKRAIEEVDKTIVRQGFRQPVATGAPQEDEEPDEDGRITIKTKDGETLGHLRAEEKEIIFEPLKGLGFTVDIPPFRSFFVERVLSNMKATDEGKASKGEIPPEEVLSFEVSTEGEQITSIAIRNYGGERRLREIRSSLRWAFDKMYEKLR